MKDGTQDHPKLKALARALRTPRTNAAGILEFLWLFTRKYARSGDIGRFRDDEIADAVDWPADRPVDELIEALVKAGWLDRSDEHRLIVHDWSEHADKAVHTWLQRKGLTFADGRLPFWRKAPCDDDSSQSGAVSSHQKLCDEKGPECDDVASQNGDLGSLARASWPVPEPVPEPEKSSSTVHAPNSTPNKRGPLAAAVTQLLGKTLAEPLPRNGAVRHTREALAAETGEMPPEQIVGRIVQEARQVDAKISDEEVALWVHGCAPEGAERGAAWFAAAVVAHIRERPREVATLREFVQGKAPPAEADALLRERGIPPRLRNALRAWRLQHSEETVENKIA